MRTALATGAGIGSEGAGAAARRDAESDRADAAVSVEDGWFRTSAAIWRGHRGGLDGGAGVVDAAAVGEGGGGGCIGQFRGEEFFPRFLPVMEMELILHVSMGRQQLSDRYGYWTDNAPVVALVSYSVLSLNKK